ncbi:MAG: HD domain-containing protein [Theionarchaea archaeon]|nr:HD domain-containing protein [Theionarchaea archaeon]
MEGNHRRIFRDAIHGNIDVNPFEVSIINTKIFQRLRYLKQTPSVSYVYHSANHSRFEHSIGTVHIAELYAQNLNIHNPHKEILRLAALLHDIGHGIFSHLYDNTIFCKIYPDIKHGHDKHRIKIITEYLPIVLLDMYKKDTIIDLLKISGLESYIKFNIDIEEGIHNIMRDVVKILTGEDNVCYNIIHGPLGCDRLDFIKRDSYFCGTCHYGGFPLDRFILYSSLKKNSDEEKILCYSSKLLDDILLFLINRFHMFKNVYFHKTCRAVDTMLRQILTYSEDPLNLIQRTSNLNEFENLNDISLFYEIKNNQKNCENAFSLVERIMKRDLYKVLYDDVEIPNESQIKKHHIQELLQIIAELKKEKIIELFKKNEGDTEIPSLFIDTPYEIKMSPLQELRYINIFDENHGIIKKYREIENERSFKQWDLPSFNIYRIYVDSHLNQMKLRPFAKQVKNIKEIEIDTQI